MINRSKGFTLIELMVVVAIIGIVAAIAAPSYDAYLRKSKRADAKVVLNTIADRQERLYLQANTYADNLAALNVSATSDEGYYSLRIDAGDASGFKATATAIAGQLSDTQCKSLSIDSIGAKTSNGGVDDANNCW